MKTFNQLLLVSIFFLTAFSCDKQDDESKVDMKNVKIDLSSARFGSNPVLLRYADIPELLRNLETLTNSVISDSHDIMATDRRISNVISFVNFKDGRAILTKVYYVDEVNRVVIGGYILNEETGTYTTIAYGEPNWDAIINGGGCPQGYSQLASCENLNNPQGCVGNAVSTYMSAHLSSIGDCVTVQVNVGALNTRVCGKIC